MVDIREKRNVLLGVTGSIASYKSAELARILSSRGYQVRVVMTESACKFISPLTMESITGNPVALDFFDGSETEDIGHIRLADWADVLVVAPATANIIAKLSNGIADCPVSMVSLATRAPVLIAPAMNVNMFENPATRDNIARLRARGAGFVDPEEGALACGWEGTGRLASPWEIFYDVRRALSSGDFLGKRVLVTTGPTREAVDPVRFFSNRSSGKMGIALAQEAYRRGADVTLVHGPVRSRVPSKIRSFPVVSALEMQEVVLSQAINSDDRPDIVIMAAAVADFRPKVVAQEKIKKESAKLSIELVENPDILAELGSKREGDKPLLVGFAVETGEVDELIESVRLKLERKSADIIVGNFANEAFDLDTNRVWIIDRNGRQEEVSTSFKSRVANKILDRVNKF